MSILYIGGRRKGYESIEEVYLFYLEGFRKFVNRKDIKRIIKNKLELVKLEEGNGLDKVI